MLQHLRDNSKGVISGILIGLLVIVFAVSGAEALFNWDSSAHKAVTVNGDVITEMEVARGVANRKQQMMSRYGDSIPAEYLEEAKLRPDVIDMLVQRTLLLQAAKANGVAADPKVITNEIATNTAFQKDGKFDNERYLQLLRYQGFTPANFQKVMGEDLMINQIQAAISTSSFVTKAEADNIVGLSFQKRDFSYAVIPSTTVEKEVVVSEEDLKAYYDAHKDTYTTPEQVAVDYIELSTDDLAANIQVTDEQIQKQFEQNTKAFVAKTERQAAHILFEGDDAMQKAEAIRAQLAAGEDFAAIAKTRSSDAGSKDQGGDLGFSSGDTFPAEFEAALAKLKVGEISAPVKTEAGVHIIKLLAERGAKAPTLEESKAAIIDQLKKSAAETQFAEKLEKLKELSYNADKLAEVAKELGLQAKNTGLFTKTGGKDLAATPAFANAAFSAEVMEQGNASEPVELAPNRVVVLKKTDRKPAELQSIEVVKAQLTETVKAQKVQSLLAEKAKQLVADVTAGKALDVQAKALSAEYKVITAASRTNADVDREVLQVALSASMPKDGKPSVTSSAVSKGFAVVVVTKVQLAGDADIPAEQRSMIGRQLASIAGDSDFKHYQAYLEQSAKIKRK